jgi:hypothetical protein
VHAVYLLVRQQTKRNGFCGGKSEWAHSQSIQILAIARRVCAEQGVLGIRSPLLMFGLPNMIGSSEETICTQLIESRHGRSRGVGADTVGAGGPATTLT